MHLSFLLIYYIKIPCILQCKEPVMKLYTVREAAKEYFAKM